MYSLTTYQGIRQTAEIICGSRDWDVVFPQAIESVESDIYKKLNVGELIDALNLTTVAGQDYVSMNSATIDVLDVVLVDGTRRTTLQPVVKELISADKSTGTPCFYYIEGSKLIFDVKASAVYSVEITRHASLSPLSETNSSNAITIAFPNIYLYGVAAFLFMISQEPALEDLYRKKFDKEISEARTKSKRKQVGPRMRMAGSRARSVF